MRQPRHRAGRPRWDRLDDRCLPSAYTPAQIAAAYGLNALTLTSSSGLTVSGDGTGQTIALVENYHDPNIQASLDAFDTKYGLPHLTLKVIDQAGTRSTIYGEKKRTSMSSGPMRSPPVPVSSSSRPRPATITRRV